jgi:maleylpyruvate isomerase
MINRGGEKVPAAEGENPAGPLPGRHDLARTLPWMREGTAHLLSLVEQLTDDALRAPSLLPGWTRAHVVAHLARNAEALTRLARWARTGIENPMYTHQEQRTAEIEASAAQSGPVLRSEVATSAHLLGETLAELDDEGWRAAVRTAQGRTVPAAEVPWMRTREVWLHAVDLGTGATVADLPAGLVDLLLDDAAGSLSGRDGCPSVLLAPADRDRTWQLGAPGGTDTSPTAKAPAAELAGWLTGRISGSALPEGLPALPNWM